MDIRDREVHPDSAFKRLIKASAGELYYNGENIYSQGYDMKQLRSKVGLVFQYPEHQLFEVDVLTDVCFGPKNQGLSREEAEARAKKALEQVGLDPSYYKQSPFELSGGQKQRLFIVLALIPDPQVVFLDELTTGLDTKARRSVWKSLQELKDRGLTIFLTSHFMDEVEELCDRIGI